MPTANRRIKNGCNNSGTAHLLCAATWKQATLLILLFCRNATCSRTLLPHPTTRPEVESDGSMTPASMNGQVFDLALCVKYARENWRQAIKMSLGEVSFRITSGVLMAQP
jgi:hypothetical protein